MEVLQPPQWPRPRGYSNGIVARGTLVFVAGQVGFDEAGHLVSGGLVPQLRQSLLNIRAVLGEAGATPENLVRLTWFLADAESYNAQLAEIGAAYRDVMGRVYPAMSVVAVRALVEAGAEVEIEATAVIPD